MILFFIAQKELYMRTFKASDDKNVKLVQQSRWLKVRCEYVTHRHSLADFADFGGTDDDRYGVLYSFIHKGKKYALGQFFKMSYPVFFYDENDKLSYLCGYDSTDYSNKCLEMEMDDACEYVRLFTEVRE